MNDIYTKNYSQFTYQNILFYTISSNINNQHRNLYQYNSSHRKIQDIENNIFT